ncbi:MAG: tetratricopeptide repeat protein, partial [Oscillospiraceae bacterium]|nr:tetratricopeptide repeat protein [Oscillospiraceae bacterium]
MTNLNWLETCFEIIYDYVPDDFSTLEARDEFSEIAAHAVSVAEYSRKTFISDEDLLTVAKLYDDLSYGFECIADLNSALKLGNKSIFIHEEVLGDNHPDTAKTYSNIALIYDEIGDYKTALCLLNKAMRIDEEALGIDHHDTAITYNNLALVYRNQGDYTKALEYF